MEIAFIGLGNMGSGMAANLVKAGHEVRAFDLNAAAVAQAVADGAVAVPSLASACTHVDVIVTMLPGAQHVMDVYTAEDGVFALAWYDTLLIDCSTIDVETSRRLSEMTTERGRGLLTVDAPVSGGAAAAKAGTLTFMVGGTDEAFAQAEPILKAMGKAVIHAGAAGAGQAAKICNNMLLAISMIGTCEAFALAEKLGLDDQTFFDIASKASGQTWAMTSYCPVPGPVPSSPANHGYRPGFAAGLMLKDLTLAMQAAGEVAADTPLGSRAHALYAALCSDGHAGLDFSAMMDRIRRGV